MAKPLAKGSWFLSFHSPSTSTSKRRRPASELLVCLSARTDARLSVASGGERGVDLEMYRGGIRKLKSQLNSKLDGVLEPYVVAQRNQDLYRIQGQLPYCWIRSRSSSALLR